MFNLLPCLTDCRRLFLRNYTLYIPIGVYAHEKKQAQRVVINVDLFIPLALSTPKADALEEVVDYDFIREKMAAQAACKHIHLLETLCDEVVEMMLAHSKVRAVRVAIEKPDIYPDCAAMGIEVFRIKEGV